ncbi:hypothetical protein [Acidianus bottle-shaped virus 3 strain ABV3]|uniref:Uncharacterized protein n=1 Tax=Acidianus bottle-shaped virus 3 strain ABV3 TaxID=1732174 RepID=A0A0N9NWC5_9VIRU|nr:hypothetical protein AVU00_gp37 [Acidianus bottle-shaped virus 3 strain ABV3]ALG96839.1 hypothetical protein [Acidianus bottle-shaped virus 3 strain ABV3]
MTQPIDLVENLISDLDKLILSINKSKMDEEKKEVLIERLIKAVVILEDDVEEYLSIYLTETPNELIDKALEKIEKLLVFCRENRFNKSMKRFEEHLLLIYDELMNDKKRLT